MKYQPTETELKEMGFKASMYDDGKGTHWFRRFMGNIDLVYSADYNWFYLCDVDGITVDIYPKSDTDIIHLIRILSP